MASSAYRVEVAQKADEDFRVALDYYMRAAGRQSAERFVARYEEVLGYLETIPTAAARVGNTQYRWMPVRNHVLVYRIDEQAATVYVARLHYGSSNWREGIEGGDSGK